ncbi:virion protein (plasmid) [Levilactobacillus brevis]|nr:virion protein [Levilactobacillus brevis]
MSATGYAIATGAGLLIVGAGAWALSQRTSAGSDPQQQSILEVLGVEDITAPLAGESQADTRPRGIRNNNPLNIESGAPWQGLAPDQTDPRFAVFIDPRYGYRAAARILQSYAKRGITTLTGILGTWAPAGENDLQAYIGHIAKRTGIAPMQHVQPGQYPVLFEAMTLHENGEQPYDLALIREGVSWA